jgi:NAD(P)H-flavin reductase
MLSAAERWGAGSDERPHLPRAFSFLRAGDGTVSFMFEDVGPGTARLAELEPGDGLLAVGPLGQGFAAPPAGGRAVLVGGGIGVPPLSAWAAVLTRRDVPWEAVLGFRDAARAPAAALLDAPPDALTVATDDGSVGHHGPVTEPLAARLDGDPVVYACGPPGMLEAVRALCARAGVPAQLALEAGMACGYGACFGCAVPVAGGGYVRVCVDGPVLDAALLEAVPAHP